MSLRKLSVLLSLMAFGLGLAGTPAQAQLDPTPSGACMRDCGATLRDLRSNPPAVQACLIRCRAGEDYRRSSGRTANQGTTGRPVPGALDQFASLNLPGNGGSYAPQNRGIASPALAARPLAPLGARWGAIYLTPAQGGGFGMSIGQGDRLTAHGAAERECFAGNRGQCRVALEFTDRCGAIAQAQRATSLVRTDDRSSYGTTFSAAASGATQAAAEAAAMADCRSRDREATCVVVRSACGP